MTDTPLSRHSKADKNFAQILQFFWSNSTKIISKADTSIKWTLFYGPKSVPFRNMLLYYTRMILTTSISVINKESPYYTEEN